ncbi:MAG: N-formylglutamate amidohydrolase [Parvibaculum sp.]
MPHSPFELINPDGDPDILLLCDHASNALPDAYGTLGLAATEFHRHIAYDIGTGPLVRDLAARLGCPAVLGTCSRLLVDLNRGADDPTIVMKLSDGSVIPDNADVDPFRNAEEFERRITLYHQPYHDAVSRQIDRARDLGRVPVVISVHSFTPVWRGVARPWEVGVLWDKDDRIARPMIAAFEAQGFVVGDNLPYIGFLKNDTLFRHGTVSGIPHVLLEIRQDLIDTEADREVWAARLQHLLPPLVTREGVHEIRHFGSRTDR